MTSSGEHRERLETLRSRYSNRRTVAAALVEEAVGLADSSVIEMQAKHDAQLAEAERQHQIQLARVEDRAQRSADRVRELEAMRTNLRESRETVDDGVLVKFTNPRTVSHSGEESRWGRPWMLGELETLCFRLRLGGATDDTEVRTRSDHTEATIPFPEMALSGPAPEPEKPAVTDVQVMSWLRRRHLARTGVACLVSMLIVELIVIWGLR